MSMNRCFKCHNIYDTDYQMEEIDGEMVCDRCYEEHREQECKNKIFTDDDLLCWDKKYHSNYLREILNKEVSVETAREDLFSLVGSKYDYRTDKSITELSGGEE